MYTKEDQESIRPEILQFAQQMELIMRKHDGNKGDSWKTCNVKFLISKLDEEYYEFFRETAHKSGISESCAGELVDVANVAMMLWNRKDGENP
jgi:NTP pyrophosphatase (non-canonical NTP hydrolase)